MIMMIHPLKTTICSVICRKLHRPQARRTDPHFHHCPDGAAAGHITSRYYLIQAALLYDICAYSLTIVYNNHRHRLSLSADVYAVGVLNVVTGTGLEAGKPLSESSRIAKIAFTGETSTGRIIMKAAAESLIPVTMELGGTTSTTTMTMTQLLRLPTPSTTLFLSSMMMYSTVP